MALGIRRRRVTRDDRALDVDAAAGQATPLNTRSVAGDRRVDQSQRADKAPANGPAIEGVEVVREGTVDDHGIAIARDGTSAVLERLVVVD